MKEAIFFCMVGLPLFGKVGSGTPVFFQNPSESPAFLLINKNKLLFCEKRHL